ncbi:hypothetical protein METH_05470 [Leisingera methylohalidivorans DSM 14336]|uniref:Uncharacterized protein n=1 Tax=Leisingera methylohalidivorans DSM 14336 TaxID=999552 RepID=V9VYT4_9RHOB|nr:hypothetical protein METH_05470 [Leisingera methylohalidivorans DSM 14336]
MPCPAFFFAAQIRPSRGRAGRLAALPPRAHARPEPAPSCRLAFGNRNSAFSSIFPNIRFCRRETAASRQKNAA